MAKTKMLNFRSRTTLNRPDGSTVTFEPGLQEVSAVPYEGKVAGIDKDGKPGQVDHPENARSDAEHWHVLANADVVETREERERADREEETRNGGRGGPPAGGGAIGTGGRGTGSTAKSDGTLKPNEVAGA